MFFILFDVYFDGYGCMLVFVCVQLCIGCIYQICVYFVYFGSLILGDVVYGWVSEIMFCYVLYVQFLEVLYLVSGDILYL